MWQWSSNKCSKRNNKEIILRIISFAWTTAALLKGKKTVTRRRWKKPLVKVGDLAQAYNRSPRFQGRRVAIIKILKVSQERLCDITDKEERKEGHLWYNAKGFIEAWIKGYPDFEMNELLWRIEFEVVKYE